MKALPLLLATVFFVGCDKVDKALSVQNPTPIPTTPKPVTPKPTPKPGDWIKDRMDNPLDRKPSKK